METLHFKPVGRINDSKAVLESLQNALPEDCAAAISLDARGIRYVISSGESLSLPDVSRIQAAATRAGLRIFKPVDEASARNGVASPSEETASV